MPPRTGTRKRKAPAKRVAKARAPKARKAQPRLATSRAPSTMLVARGIGRYLEECRPKTARARMEHRNPEQIQASIEKLEAKLPELGAIAELDVRNKIVRLKQALRQASNGDARRFFIEHAASYAGRKQIAHAAFRSMGVPASVLREAGIRP